MLLAVGASGAGCRTAAPVEESSTRPVEVRQVEVRQVEVRQVEEPSAHGVTTPAEASGYTRTSTYREVVDLLRRLDAESDLEVAVFGESGEGRQLPLAFWGVDEATFRGALEPSKTRVLVVANIHGGEVAGKDAMLELLRDLAAGHHAHWADSLVVAVAPIYNADGNERMGYDNRPRQDGPVEGMGERANADGLDLNRDFLKVASPEARALVGLIRDLHPHVVLDLHTTNGTAMGYHLTYAPGLSPDTPPAIDADLRERWLPTISDSLLASDDFATYHYGNVPGAFGEEATAPRGWYSFSARPRFSTNYVGLRGRYAILSEAYSYAPFRERVAVTRRFVEEVLDRVWSEASLVRRRVLEADANNAVGEPVALRTTWDALDQPVEVLLGEVDTLRHPVTGDVVLRRRDVRRPEVMPAFVRFQATETTTAPARYLVTGPAVEPVRAVLDVHGVRYRTGTVDGPRQRFRVDSVAVAERPFQGVRTRDVFGVWADLEGAGLEASDLEAETQGIVVEVGQPLGRLAVVLLEPRSDDGLAAWGVIEAEAGALYPIARVIR